VHASLLPALRGAAPIQWAILRGLDVTGVTLMQMDAGMDTGPMLATSQHPIAPTATAGSLHAELAEVGAALLDAEWDALVAGRLAPVAQDDAAATTAPMLDKDTGRIDFSTGVRAVCDRVRGCDPWPGAFTTVGGDVLKVFSAKRVSGRGEAGVVLDVDRDGLVVGCGDGAVALGELQLPGRKRMAAKALVAGRDIPRGTKLG
jgi:methionyl-tRNA formyltransferase